MIDLLTVVYREELDFLKTQARSVELYTRQQDIKNIYVIVNDVDSVVDLIDPAWYGILQSKVKIVPYSIWTYDMHGINGWQSQQICKLLGAREALSTWSMCLDSKTWFIQPLNLSKLFDSQRRVNAGVWPVFPAFTNSQRFLEKYYSISMPETIGPGGVPFVFHNETVRALVNSFDDFVGFFKTNMCNSNAITEFHLYSSFILAKDGTYERLYNKTPYYKCHNIAEWEIDKFDRLHELLVDDPLVLTASMHRKAYSLLHPEQLDKWHQFLTQKKLNISTI